ncbi:PilZ domain-containing protein [Lamprobacter modestohalophilus]|nr:PilZ domain-containing protein [Lamprobacter modestohalophilus]
MGFGQKQALALAEPAGRYDASDSPGASPGQRRDQRRHQRLSYRDPVQARLIGLPGAMGATQLWALLAHDLSETGSMLSSPELFPVHSRLLLVISPAEVSEPIRVVGRVIWVAREDLQERYQLGVHFEEASDLARVRLQQLVAKRARSAAGARSDRD